MNMRFRCKAFFIALTVVLLLTVFSQASVLAAGGEGSSGSVWIIVFLAAIWLVVIAAVLFNVFRIRRREKREEEEGVEFTSKEH